MEEQQNIFEAFHQKSGQSFKKYGGTGLGLSISKRLVEMMGGSILVKSAENIGTTFRIVIPDVLISFDEFESENIDAYSAKSKTKNNELLIVNTKNFDVSIFFQLPKNNNLRMIDSVDITDQFIQNMVAKPEFIDDEQTRPDIIFVYLSNSSLRELSFLRKYVAQPVLSVIPVVAITPMDYSVDIQQLKVNGIDCIIREPYTKAEIHQVIKKYMYVKNSKKDEDSGLYDFSSELNLLVLNEYTLAHLSDFMETIDEELLPEFEQIIKTSKINQIKTFGYRIKEVGSNYQLDIFNKFGDELLKESKSFNIKRIKKILEHFPEIVGYIAKLSKEGNV